MKEEAESKMPRVELFDNRGAGLILPCKSGVWVSNQVGGFSCGDFGIEGVFAPIRFDTKAFQEHFGGEPWRGQCCGGIDEETADFVDAWITKACGDWHPAGSPFKVNRARLAECQEAWILVTLTPAQYMCLGIAGWSGDAVLTWKNSD